MRGFTAILFLTMTAWPLMAWAIVHDQFIVRTSQEDGFTGKVGGSLETASGNNFYNSASGLLGGEFNRWETAPSGKKFLRHATGARGSYKYRALEWDEPFANSAFVYVRYIYGFSPHWGIKSFAQSEYDRFTGLNFRAIVGVGPQWTIINNNMASVILNTSFMPEYEILPQGENTGAAIFRGQRFFWYRWNNALTVTLNFDERNLILRNSLYVQPRFDLFADYRALNVLEASFKVGERIDWSLSWQVHHDSMPPVGVKKTDRRFNTVLGYQF